MHSLIKHVINSIRDIVVLFGVSLRKMRVVLWLYHILLKTNEFTEGEKQWIYKKR